MRGRIAPASLSAKYLNLLLVAVMLASLTLAASPVHPVSAAGTVSLTAFGTPYTQDFDTLASSGTANTVVPTGWEFSESGTNANLTYRAGTGSDNAGDTYSFGATGNSERAFGGLRSGSLVPLIGAQFTNNMGGTITSLDIAYTGEQWRLGQNTTGRAADRLDFQVSTNATSITTGTWNDYDTLDFSSPVVAGATGALNGNVAPNRTALSFTITGLNIANGASFWIRWADSDLIPGADDGLAVDDFSVTGFAGAASTDPTGVGSADPATVAPGIATTFTVDVTPGTNPASTNLAVSCDLSSIGGAASQALSNGGSGSSFSYAYTVPASTVAQTYALPCTVVDGESRSSSLSIALTVKQLLAIGTIQGSTDTSPENGHSVLTTGVVYDLFLNGSGSQRGFYIQSKDGTDDGNQTTSDGLFVFMGRSTTVGAPLGGTYTPAIGDEVVLLGTVSEYQYTSGSNPDTYSMTELTNSSLVQVVNHYDNLAGAVTPTQLVPGPDDFTAYEKVEGMRMVLPAGAAVVAPTRIFSSNTETMMYLVRGDSAVAARTDFARRVYRDQYDEAPWLIIGIQAEAMKGGANNRLLQLPGVSVYNTTNVDLVGPMHYGFNDYTFMPDNATGSAFTAGLDPSANNPPTAADRTFQYNIQTFNVNNLYDYLNNPDSLCDFTGDPGCPSQYPNGSSAKPPFDYPAASLDAYLHKVERLAAQITGPLHAPDIIAIEEAEAQDVCSGGGQYYGTCDTVQPGAANSGYDGKIDALQDLAHQIFLNSGISYQVANDTNATAKLPRGGDYRGIMVGYLYRTDRVELVQPSPDDPVLGNRQGDPDANLFPHNQDVANPKVLNAHDPAAPDQWLFDRPVTAALWRIHRAATTDGDYIDVYTLANHFASGPNSRVALRTAQATYNATQVQSLKAANANVRSIVLGDLNVYPDGYGTLLYYNGNPGTAVDQLAALKAQMFNTYYNQPLAGRFSYTYNGMTQALDQIFVTSPLLGWLGEVRSAHLNADYPYTLRDLWKNPDDTLNLRNTSDHDPTVATFNTFHWSGFFSPVDNFPVANTVKAGSAVPVKFSLNGDQGLNILEAGYPKMQATACDPSEPTDAIEDTTTAGQSALTYDATTGQYTYVWKTNKAWAGTCGQLIVKLVDGTVHVANFSFMK